MNAFMVGVDCVDALIRFRRFLLRTMLFVPMAWYAPSWSGRLSR